MHPEQHTDPDNLNTVQHNLRNSAKGSNDAYDVTVSLTHYNVIGPGHRRRYARQAAHRSTPRNMPITAIRKACPVSQSSLFVCRVR